MRAEKLKQIEALLMHNIPESSAFQIIVAQRVLAVSGAQYFLH